MTATRKALAKWAASIAFVVIVVLLIATIRNATALIILGLVFAFLALPMVILVTIEAGKTFRVAADAPRVLRFVGFILLIPQVLLGFLSAAAGVAIILWVAYNFLVERQPQFTGGLIPSLGLGPALAAGGYWWMRSAFKRK
jgi:hypothetical protein